MKQCGETRGHYRSHHPKTSGFLRKKNDLFCFSVVNAASLRQMQQGAWEQVYFWVVLGVFQVFCTFWGRTAQSCAPGGLGGHDSGRDSPPALLSLLPGPSFHTLLWAGLNTAKGRFYFVLFRPSRATPKEKRTVEGKASRHGGWARAASLFEGTWWELAGQTRCQCGQGETPRTAGTAIPAQRGLTLKMEEELTLLKLTSGCAEPTGETAGKPVSTSEFLHLIPIGS